MYVCNCQIPRQAGTRAPILPKHNESVLGTLIYYSTHDDAEMGNVDMSTASAEE